MTDAVALLAISQVICLGSVAYLYAQLQSVKQRPARQRPVSARVRSIEDDVKVQASGPAHTPRPRNQPQRAMDAAAIAARMQETGLDVPALARRMRKSEEEVRLLLRRQGVLR